jgi:putative membrane protein
MTTAEVFTSLWQLDPVGLAVIAAFVAAGIATRVDRAPRRAIPLSLAIVLLAVALLSPVGRLADGYLFSAHMLQHLLLVLAVPPLALLGLGGREGPRKGPRAAWALCWGLGVGAMWLWHAPTLCNAASTSASVHRLQEASLLAMGTAFWWPLLAPRVGARLSPLGGMAYLFTACTACTLLGVLITFAPVEVCSVFLHPADSLGVLPLIRQGWGLTPERDQRIGGLLMWVPACLVYGAGILGQLGRLLRDEGGLDEGGIEETT